MEERKIALMKEEVAVVDGKVVISSEELARAIQDENINLAEEESAEVSINFGCRVSASMM